MKATIHKPANAIKAKSHRKENHFMYEYSAICYSKGKYHVPVTLRIYGTNAMNYCCLWAHGNAKNGKGNEMEGKYFSMSGSGSAGGCGYHRPSAAAQEAINRAGITLSEPIDGRGDSMIMEAVQAIAQAMGFRKVYVHRAHA